MPRKGVNGMKIAITGIDGRFVCLERQLQRKGHEIVKNGRAHLAIGTWPQKSAADADRIVACGPNPAPTGVIDLLRDEEYQKEIAAQTAEGALCAAMNGADFAIGDANCLITGWGRIGQALTRLLSCMGARVTVLTRRDSVFGQIRQSGGHPADASAAASRIAGKRLIFATTPQMILNREVLSRADRGALLLDLASAPHGADIDAAAELGLNARREPGLPGRYCPESAARAICDALERGGLLDE